MGKLKTFNVPGHAYFVTTRLFQGTRLFISDNYCQIIINNFNFYRRTKQFKLLGYVIMPTHLHYIIWPAGRYTISEILMNFKKFTAKQIIKQLKNDSILKETSPPIIPRVARTPRSGLPIERGRPNFFTVDCLHIFNKAAQNIRDQNYKVWMSRNWVENIYSIQISPAKVGLYS